MSDRVSPELLQGVKDSLSNLNVESILLSGDVQPYLESRQPRIFNSVGYTERPDVLCSKLLEGRIGVLIDGTPYVLIVPKLFTDSFQTLDDYTGKPFYATFIRWLKYLAFILAITLPSFYVAICTHAPQLLNRELLTILADAERNAPFPILVECFVVLVVYEVIKEAGVRLPKPIGGAVSIVAGLIIGDCAVSSGFISNPLLVVSAVAVVCGFTVPDLTRQVSVLRLCYLLVGGAFGLYGISLLSMVVIVNVCATQDYGFAYSYPLTPFDSFAMRDVLMRVSSRKMKQNQFTIKK
jgi:spore germination protein KA